MKASVINPAEDLKIRRACMDDLDALVDLEEEAFANDRLSRRSLRAFLQNTHNEFLVACHQGQIVGYALVLFRAGTALARLYSIAVARHMAGQGVGGHLFARCEEAALARDCIFMRLEVRKDNAAAIGLYRKQGYRLLDTLPAYYEDNETALRFEKRLSPHIQLPVLVPPYFRQTMDFTCGPACALMAMAWADRSLRITPTLELKLWREATTIFMTSGLGGCEPFGLAVALRRHGLLPSLYVSHRGPYFLESVRSEEKKQVMRLTQIEFQKEADEMGIPVHHTALSLNALTAHFDQGGIAIVLVSGYRMFRQKAPHWVLAFGHDARHIFVHDPYIDDKDFETSATAESMPIPLAEFQRMTRYGKDNLRAALLIRKADPS